jgi:hypothetical protein
MRCALLYSVDRVTFLELQVVNFHMLCLIYFTPSRPGLIFLGYDCQDEIL